MARVVVLAALAALAIPASAEARTTALVFHSGSFSGDEPVQSRVLDALRQSGLVVEVVDYRLTGPADAYADARAAAHRARRHGRVVAYGVSAGGSIAAWLSARGLVDRAVSVAGPMVFTAWHCECWPKYLGETELRRLSPIANITPRAKPLLIAHDPDDYIVDFDHALAMWSADRRARLRIVSGNHAAILAPQGVDWLSR